MHIKPLTLTPFWHRRICEAIMLVATIILGLYFLTYFSDIKDMGMTFVISQTVVIMAVVALIAGFVSYFWIPRHYIFWGSLAAFTLLAVTTAILIMSTGVHDSPFIALWMVVSIFAGVFGVFGIIPLFIALTSLLVLQFSAGTLTREAIIIIVLAGELPLAISYLLWHTKSANDTTSDRAYRDLASELSQVANKAEVVINAIADGVVAVNSHGVIQLINPAAQQIIGWGKQDALTLDYKSVLKLVDTNGDELGPAADPVLQTLANNKQTTSNAFSLITNSQKKLLVSVIVSPVGQLGAGAIVVFRDITNEKIEEREQAEFISTASHEMRTPVASIEGYLGLALNPTIAQIDDKAREYINKAHESAEHLGRLFQDLLDVTKADDGRLSNNPKVVDVVAFTHDIIQGLKPQATAKGLRMLFKPQPDDDDSSQRNISPVFYITVDNDHLSEVVGNLIENAIKYTPHGDVVVDVSGDTEHVKISVADSGIGIPKEDQAHLFQKFYRVDNSETRELGGTGLGLYLCRRLTEAMNGRLWVDSEYKQGSTFYVEFDRTSHEDAMRQIEAASHQPVSQIVPSDQTYLPDANVTNTAADIVTVPIASSTSATPNSPPSTPQPPATTPIAAPQPPDTNPSLTTIEQNPSGYLQPRDRGVSVPPRTNNKL